MKSISLGAAERSTTMAPRPIAKLRKTLPEFLTIQQYCEVKRCCRASAYKDMRRVPGLGVKIGSRTFIVRDVALDDMELAQTPQPWRPQRDRTAAKIAPRKRRSKQAAAPRQEAAS